MVWDNGTDGRRWVQIGLCDRHSNTPVEHSPPEHHMSQGTVPPAQRAQMVSLGASQSLFALQNKPPCRTGKGCPVTPPHPSRGLGRAAQQCAQNKRRKLEGQKAPSCSSRAPPTGFSRFPRTPDSSWAAFRNQGTGECLLPQAGPATPETHRVPPRRAQEEPPISTPHLRPLPSVSPPPRPD